MLLDLDTIEPTGFCSAETESARERAWGNQLVVPQQQPARDLSYNLLAIDDTLKHHAVFEPLQGVAGH
jgi:hypothetical protein